MPEPTVSVIVPVYNTAAYLARCLDSVLGQTLDDLEVILVDDGSTDDSGRLCDAYAMADKRVRVIHQANAGASAARNAGLQIAGGAYIGFVDSDDWIEPDTYAYLLGLLESHQADVAEIMLEVAYTSDHQVRRQPERVEVWAGEDILIRYFEHNEFAMGLRLYQRRLLADFSFEVGRINEDVVAGFEVLSRARRLVASNQIKYHYFSNPVGVSESPLGPRDLDLIHAGQRLEELTAATANAKLRQLALAKQRRAPFTLLVKLAVFGCSAELNQAETVRSLKADIQRHFGFLLRSGMPFNRKLLLIGCRYCYPLVRLAGWAYTALRGLRRQTASQSLPQ